MHKVILNEKKYYQILEIRIERFPWNNKKIIEKS